MGDVVVNQDNQEMSDPLDTLQPPRRVPDMNLYLIAFKDGSYKKILTLYWKHSQWIHFTLPDSSIVRVNPDNVNYMHQGVPE